MLLLDYTKTFHVQLMQSLTNNECLIFLYSLNTWSHEHLLIIDFEMIVAHITRTLSLNVNINTDIDKTFHKIEFLFHSIVML